MGIEVAIIFGILGIGSWIVWGVVAIVLANMGVRYPEHKSFFTELITSKKMQFPTISLNTPHEAKKEVTDDKK